MKNFTLEDKLKIAALCGIPAHLVDMPGVVNYVGLAREQVAYLQKEIDVRASEINELNWQASQLKEFVKE
jgi:hypothetical protein